MAQANRERSLYGRKVFFVSPHFILRAKLLRDLWKDDFEVYAIDETKKIKGLIQRFPSCIIFFNIDETRTKASWLSYIRAIEDSFPQAHIGVAFSVMSDEEKLKFTSSLNLLAGFINIGDKQKDPLEEIKKLLTDMKAKGRRKYIRASCEDDQQNNHAVLNINTKNYNLKLQDISLAGISLIVPDDMTSYFLPHTVVRGVFITLAGIDFTHPIVIFGMNNEHDKNILICLFLPGLPNSIKSQIHKYVCDTKTKEFSILLEGIQEDAI